MNKVISFILAVLTILSLSSCGIKNESTNYDDVNGTQEMTTILPYRRDIIPNHRYPVLCRNLK